MTFHVVNKRFLRDTQTPAELELIQLVTDWQDAVRRENRGMGSASPTMADSTDRAWRLLETALTLAQTEALANLIYRYSLALDYIDRAPEPPLPGAEEGVTR